MLDGTPAKSTHGEQIRDFLFVEDVASAFVHLLDCEVNGAVNIASGEPLKIKKVVGEIAEIMGRPDLVRLGAIPAPENEPSLLVADTTRLTQEVNWTSSNTLRDGLEKTVDWWRKEKKDDVIEK
jgi:nucleoside-diphosphate-sugar epimerase